VLGVPAAIAGLIVALALVPAGGIGTSLALAAAVAALTMLLLVAAGYPTGSAAPRDPTRETGIVRRAGARRLAAEAAIVVVAIAGAFLLRDRGVQGASATGTLGAPDPLIAAVPALVGIAAGIVAVRLYPIPMRFAASLAARRRGYVTVHAMRRITRGGSGGLLLIALIAMTTIGVFASATLLQLDRAADAAAWRDVGSAFRLTTTASAATGTKAGSLLPLPAGFDPAALPGVEASALAYRADTPFFPRGSRLELLALDPAAYERVVAGTPIETTFPPALHGAAGGSAAGPAGTDADPIPAIVSGTLAEGVGGSSVGDTFRLIVGGLPRTFRVVEVRDAFPSLADVDRFAIVALDHLGAALLDDTPAPNAAYVRAPDDAGPALRDALAAAESYVTVAGRAEETAALRDAPVVGAVSLGVGLVALFAALYAALAVAAVLGLSGAARAIEVAQLRTLGLTGRQSVWLIVAEHGPTVAVAFVVGVVLGVALFAFLRPGLGLVSIIGSDVSVPIVIDPAHVITLLATVIAIVGIGIGIAATIERRAVPALAVRRRIE
jgi:putative ABC transport system permease protein